MAYLLRRFAGGRLDPESRILDPFGQVSAAVEDVDHVVAGSPHSA
jgi:hypothetical protein